MNIKKLIALGLSSMMIFSSVIASAELTTNGESITSFPTLDEIQARTPEISFSVGDPYATAADAKKAVAFTKRSAIVDGNIYFPVTVTVSNLGKLASGPMMIDEENFIICGCMLNEAKFALPTNKIKVAKVASSSTKIGSVAWLDDGIGTTDWKAGWQAGPFENCYPTPDTENGSLKEEDAFTASATYVVGIAAQGFTSDITLNKEDITASITYWVGDKLLSPAYGFASMTTTNVTIKNDVTFKAPVTESTATPWDVTITEQSPAADAPAYTGYIWKLDVTPHDGDLTKFDVKFTDDNKETFDRSILSATKDALNWNAATSFFVGLYTTKHTGVTPTWDVESTKNGEVIKANIK